MRFGGEDVVRHRLVQRIVEAYDEHAQRAAPELRRRSAASVLEVEVVGDRGVAGAAEVERLWRSRWRRAGVEDGHVAVEFVDADRIRELNREHRGKDAPDRRPVVPDRRGRRRRPTARASSATS